MSAGNGFIWDSIAAGPVGTEWSHAGIAADELGHLYWAHPAGEQVLVRHLETGGVGSIAVPLLEIHDIATTARSAGHRLWLADPGFKMRPPGYEPEVRNGRAGVLELSSGMFTDIAVPDHPAYVDSTWRPTAVAVDDAEEVTVVADGYGASLVHFFTNDGAVTTIDGTQTGTPFMCPHGLAIIAGPSGEELVIADRGNRRLVFTDLTGELQRVMHDPVMRAPSGLASHGRHVIVTDLDGALLRLDVFTGGMSVLVPFPVVEKSAGWPNAQRDGQVTRPDLEYGVLNSPHGVVVLRDGSICLTEWVIGGRELRLTPAAIPTADS